MQVVVIAAAGAERFFKFRVSVAVTALYFAAFFVKVMLQFVIAGGADQFAQS